MKCAWQFYSKSTLSNHSFTIIIHKSNQIKCWFFKTGENGSTRGKASQTRIESQQSHSFTCGAKCGNWTQATLVEGNCSHNMLLSFFKTNVVIGCFFFYCWGLLFVTCSIAGRTWSALGFAILRLASFQKGNFAYGKPNMTLPLLSCLAYQARKKE